MGVEPCIAAPSPGSLRKWSYKIRGRSSETYPDGGDFKGYNLSSSSLSGSLRVGLKLFRGCRPPIYGFPWVEHDVSLRDVSDRMFCISKGSLPQDTSSSMRY